MAFVFQTFNILVDLLITLLFIRVVLSWMVRDKSPLTEFLNRCTDPILVPIRRVIPIVGGMDFSPVVAYFLLQILRQLINSLFL